MTTNDVGDLVAEDHRDIVVGRRILEHPRVEADFAAWHREGVGRLIVDDGELPLRGGRQDAGLVVATGGGDNLQADLPDLGQALIVGELLHLRELRSGHRGHFRFVDEDKLGAARDGHILAANEGESGQKEEERAHGEIRISPNPRRTGRAVHRRNTFDRRNRTCPYRRRPCGGTSH